MVAARPTAIIVMAAKMNGRQAPQIAAAKTSAFDTSTPGMSASDLKAARLVLREL